MGIVGPIRAKFADNSLPQIVTSIWCRGIFRSSMEPKDVSDWEKLGKLAFRRREKTGDLFKRLLSLQAHESEHPELRILRDWLLVPLTLWPVDIAGLAEHVCATLEAEQQIEPRLVFILDQLRHLPPENAQKAISEYEKFVEKGDYEPLIRTESKCKYAHQEVELLQNSKLQDEWTALKALFDVKKYRDKKGIIRRRMVQERNFRPDWQFKWRKVHDRFKPAFDAFCHRWNLYGMEGDKPLLLKLSVNPTAHGLMIVIPSFWSFDLKRDLDAKAISKLHKSRGALRQGPKMGEGRLERHDQAKRAFAADQTAKSKRIRGAARIEFVRKQLSLPNTQDDRSIRRMIKEGSSL